MSWTCREVELPQEDPGNPFASAAWLSSASALTGGRPLRLQILKGDEPVGSAFLHERKGPAGTEVCPPPFGVFHGVSWRRDPNPAAARRGGDVLAGSEALADWLASRYAAAALVLPPPLADVRGFLWKGWTARLHYTWRIPMGDPGSARAACADDVRQSVRKAEKAGLKVSEASDLGTAVDLWMATAARQGVSPAGSREGLLTLFGSLRKAGLLEVWEVPSLAAVWILKGQGWTGYWLAANAEEGLKRGANALVLWQLLEILAPRGGILDLCGADYPSIAHFKGKFGGELTPYVEVSKAMSLRARIRKGISR